MRLKLLKKNNQLAIFVLLAIIVLVPCTIAGSMVFSQTAEDPSQGTRVSDIGSQRDPVAGIASNNTEDALSTYTKKDSNITD
jgi:hypothetical protein